MTHRIVVDVLALSPGGTTRAQAFLAHLRQYDSSSHVLVVGDSDAHFLPADDARLETASVFIGGSFSKPLRRIVWQNSVFTELLRRWRANTYISFSHYLPWRLPSEIYSIVGVSNLAPFSRVALNAERALPPKLRLAVLRRTIVSSARRASQVVALSETCRAALVAQGVSASKIVVIPNGVETDIQRRGADAADAILAGHQVEQSFVLCVSHFYRYKNFSRLLEAYARLPSSLQRRYQLVIVGLPQDRAYFQEVVRASNALGIGSRTRLIPGVPPHELGAFYSRAAVFVFPSLVENCPNTLLEAMAWGAPVLTSVTPPMPEFGGDAAEYFDPLRAEEITGRLEAVLHDPARRTLMGHAASAQAKRFSWKTFTKHIVELYADG